MFKLLAISVLFVLFGGLLRPEPPPAPTWKVWYDDGSGLKMFHSSRDEWSSLPTRFGVFGVRHGSSGAGDATVLSPLDLTSALTLDVTATWSAADPANTTVMDALVVEILYPFATGS